jgi:hypothetical protein
LHLDCERAEQARQKIETEIAIAKYVEFAGRCFGHGLFLATAKSRGREYTPIDAIVPKGIGAKLFKHRNATFLAK